MNDLGSYGTVGLRRRGRASDAAAIAECRESVAVSSFWIADVDLVPAYGRKGMDAEAQAAVADLETLNQGYSVKNR